MWQRRLRISLWACFLVFFLALGAPTSGADRKLEIYESELIGLVQLSSKANELAETLKGQLLTSEQNSQKLAEQLLMRSLEVENLRQKSEETLARLESSQGRSDQLEELRKNLSESLANLQKSFEEYKNATEARIRELESEKLIWAVIALALGFGGGWLIGHFF